MTNLLYNLVWISRSLWWLSFPPDAFQCVRPLMLLVRIILCAVHVTVAQTMHCSSVAIWFLLLCHSVYKLFVWCAHLRLQIKSVELWFVKLRSKGVFSSITKVCILYGLLDVFLLLFGPAYRLWLSLVKQSKLFVLENWNVNQNKTKWQARQIANSVPKKALLSNGYIWLCRNLFWLWYTAIHL